MTVKTEPFIVGAPYNGYPEYNIYTRFVPTGRWQLYREAGHSDYVLSVEHVRSPGRRNWMGKKSPAETVWIDEDRIVFLIPDDTQIFTCGE